MIELQYLQYCLGSNNQLPQLSADEWIVIYDFCLRQSLVGIGFCGIERISQEQKPPKGLLLQWYVMAQQIESRNRLLNERSIELQELFAEAGFATCILKGQGNARMYPNPLRRQGGDIDIWVEGKTKDVIGFLATKCDIKEQVIGYHHVGFPIWKDVDVEVHWRPSWKSSPLYNHRMQCWFREQSDVQFAHIDEQSGLHVPTWGFNVVYQLQHMFLHVLQEGLGMRQVMDYYYLLMSTGKREENGISKTLQHLGLWKFAGAVMYVLKAAFALDEQYMIAPIDEKRGKLLLSEILQSGNFGHIDKRNSSLHRKSGISRSVARLKRQDRFLMDYPTEVLCAPFQIYHLIWRKMKLWRF